MSCREFIEFLWKYTSGELAENERARFDSHLAECLGCVRYLDTYKRTVGMGQQAFADLEGEVPSDVPDELVEAILDSRAKSVRTPGERS